MKTSEISDLHPEDAAQPADAAQSQTPKAPYEAPQLTEYGQLRHLTMQNISGGGDSGDI